MKRGEDASWAWHYSPKFKEFIYVPGPSGIKMRERSPLAETVMQNEYRRRKNAHFQPKPKKRA